MKLEHFLTDLKDRFYCNNTFMKRSYAAEQSVLETIKSYFIKRDLVIITKYEYEKLIQLALETKEH